MKKKVLILACLAVLIIAALVALIILLGKDNGAGNASAYKYSYKVKGSTVDFTVSRNGADGYTWVSDTANDGMISVEKTEKKTEDNFIICVADDIAAGEVQFTLCNEENSIDRIYRIYLAFERDEKGKLAVASERYEELEQIRSVSIGDGLTCSIAQNPEGTVTVLVPVQEDQSNIWNIETVPGISVNGPVTEEAGQCFEIVPLFTDESNIAGQHTVKLYNTESGIAVNITVNSDNRGVLTLDNYNAEKIDVIDSEETRIQQAFIYEYGEISVPEDAVLSKFDTGLWTVKTEDVDGTKPYGSMIIKTGGKTYLLCLSDEATFEEFSADSKVWADSEKRVSVSGVSGYFYVKEAEKVLVWEKSGRVYQLTSKNASEDEFAALANTVCG